MFGLSLAETAIIFLVALLVIGPKELPAVVRAVSKVMKQLRGYANEFRKAFDDLAEETQLKELKDELTVAQPTIIDLDGNEQPTYDISEEMAEYQSKREKKKAKASEVKEDADDS